MATVTQNQGNHPPGCYYVNVQSGTIQRQCNPLGVLALAAAGFFGNNGLPAIPENAFATFDEAHAFADTIVGNVGGATGAVGGQSAGAANPSIGDIWNGLNVGNVLLRVGEVILGIVLLGVGIAHVTGTDNVISKAVKAKV